MDAEQTAGPGATPRAPGSEVMLDITVLMGGPSSEREVSIMSGTAIADALKRVGHTVTCADISRNDTTALDREGIDVVFIALHGDFGESGQVQALCEAEGLRYTGAGPLASEMAMDKAASKQVFKQVGLRTPDWMIIEQFHPPEMYRQWLRELPPPVVVKPVNGGSSVDITIARTADERDEVMSEVVDAYGRVMLERFVTGREVTVGILGEEALPVLEIVPARRFYDYTAKYADDSGTRYVFDHGIADELCREAQEAALVAHRSLCCRDMSRVDFILDTEDNLQVLEINTIPGFTGHSLLPMAAAKAGISFEQLVDRIARMAMAR